MKMDWWEELSSDEKSDFVAYLRKASKIKNLPGPMLEDQQRLRELIIPTMDPAQGDGYIPEEMDSVRNLGQRWKMTNHMLAAEVRRLYNKMLMPISAVHAGRIVGRSPSTLRRWARTGKIHADVDARGHWSFTRQALIDHLR